VRWLAIAALALVVLAVVLLVSTREKTSGRRVEVAGPSESDAASVSSDAPVRSRAARESSDAGTDVRAPSAPDAHGVPEEVLDDVRESGPASGAWTAAALALLRGLHAVETSELACYAAGCTVRATFASEDGALDEIALWQSSDAYAAWTGGAMVTPATKRPDGRVVVVVVVYPPK